MVHLCNVNICKNSTGVKPNLHFHRFPLSNQPLLNLWLCAINRADWTPSKYSRVCSDHFLPSDYKSTTKKTILKPDAVPNLTLSTSLCSIKDSAFKLNVDDSTAAISHLKAEIEVLDDTDISMEENCYHEKTILLSANSLYNFRKLSSEIQINNVDLMMEREQAVDFELNIKDQIEVPLQSLEEHDQRTIEDNDVDIKEEFIEDSKDYEFYLKHVKYESTSNKEVVDEVVEEEFQRNSQELSLKQEQDMDSELTIKEELQDSFQSFDEHREKSIAFDTANIKEELITDSEKHEIYPKLVKNEGTPFTEQNNFSSSCEEDNHPNMGEVNFGVDTDNVNATCSLRDKKLVSENSLASHMEMHEGIKYHICSVCYKKFTLKENLTKHMKIHAGILDHKCSVCDEKFTRKDYLNRHMKKHAGIRDHKCSVCDKKFARKDYLTRHMEIHAGIRNHKCSVCDKKFIRKDYLTRHMEIHAAILDHKCSVCDKMFIRKDYLTTHENT